MLAGTQRKLKDLMQQAQLLHYRGDVGHQQQCRAGSSR